MEGVAFSIYTTIEPIYNNSYKRFLAVAAPNITKHVLLQIEYFVEAGSQPSLPRIQNNISPPLKTEKRKTRKRTNAVLRPGHRALPINHV